MLITEIVTTMSRMHNCDTTVPGLQLGVGVSSGRTDSFGLYIGHNKTRVDASSQPQVDTTVAYSRGTPSSRSGILVSAWAYSIELSLGTSMYMHYNALVVGKG